MRFVFALLACAAVAAAQGQGHRRANPTTLGLVVFEHGGKVVVHEALEGSPAAKAGVLAGDAVVKVGPREVKRDEDAWATAVRAPAAGIPKEALAGQKAVDDGPSYWGIRELSLSGNVQEWCSDFYNPNYYRSSPTKNPNGPPSGSSRILRGGAFNQASVFCTIYKRQYEMPDVRSSNIGFRLIKIMP